MADSKNAEKAVPKSFRIFVEMVICETLGLPLPTFDPNANTSDDDEEEHDSDLISLNDSTDESDDEDESDDDDEGDQDEGAVDANHTAGGKRPASRVTPVRSKKLTLVARPTQPSTQPVSSA